MISGTEPSPLPAATRPAAGVSVIVNEQAGAVSRDDTGARIQSLFATEGVPVRLERVRPGADLAARARQAAARGDTLVAAGGDGTVGAVASVAVETRAVLGVLPLGTLNHFARDLKIPMSLPLAVRAIAAGRIHRVDAGEVNGRIFVNNASLGLYARMVWARQTEERRGRKKPIAFALAIVRTWQKYPVLTARLVVDDTARIVRTPFIFVGNNEYIARGFNLGSRTTLEGGRLSVFVAPAIGRFEILALPIRAVLGRLDPDAHLASFVAHEAVVELARPRISVALDGEVTVLQPPLRYRIRPGALKVLLPPAPST